MGLDLQPDGLTAGLSISTGSVSTVLVVCLLSFLLKGGPSTCPSYHASFGAETLKDVPDRCCAAPPVVHELYHKSHACNIALPAGLTCHTGHLLLTILTDVNKLVTQRHLPLSHAMALIA